MKKYNNFCITWNENGAKNEQILFCKLYAIKTYMELLTSNREISSLAIFGITRKDFNLENITGTVNRFLNN